MGEVQRQGYICKICSKSCVSGKSLGGHMRVHLALISASKRAAKEIDEIKVELEGGDDHDGSCQLKESCKNQSNSGFPVEEKIKHCEGNADFGEGDQSSSYGLRENPKKSWRISDSRRGVSKIRASCKECGKDFSSLRALSGHMRSHAIKNKKVHMCKKCGKGFDSMRAMFGHMKSHSVRSTVPDDTDGSWSDLDSLCPIRRKRSRIRYKSTPNPSLSSLNAATSNASERGEVEEVARCLMMLSRGVSDWVKVASVTESSDDDSVYFGAESSCKSKDSSAADADSLCEGDLDMKMNLSTGSANAFAEKNMSEFEDLGSRFAAEDPEIEVNLDVSNDGQPSVHKIVEPEQLKEFVVGLDCLDDSRCSDYAKYAKPCKDLLGDNTRNEASLESFKSNSCKKESFLVQDSGFGKNFSETETKELEILKDFGKKHGRKRRRTCYKVSDSQCVLRGNNSMQGNSSSRDTNTGPFAVTEAASKLDQLDCSDNLLEQERADMGVVSVNSSKSKEHECPICFKVFPSGQALGGHKRAHYTGSNESQSKESVAKNQEVADVHNLLDLNYPASVDECSKSDVGLNLWLGDRRSHEHKALVLTN